MEIRVTIDGIEEMIRSLDNLVREQSLRAALMSAAYYVSSQAIIRAPVDTGFLRSSIQIESVSSREAVIAAMAEYAIYQEMGTRRMAAHPFMRPALEEHPERISSLIRNALQRSLQ